MKRQFEKRSSLLREMEMGTRQIQELLADSVREIHDLDSKREDEFVSSPYRSNRGGEICFDVPGRARWI